MELDSRKKSRCDRLMGSKSFETQKAREIGRKEAVESRGSPILWMAIYCKRCFLDGKKGISGD